MGIYKEYIKNDIRSQLNYPVDFLIQLVIWSICSFLPFIALYALFTKFKNIGNWKIYECAMLYSVIVLSYDFARMIGRGFDDFHTLVQNGDIEIFLIRPHPIILQVFTSKFFLRRLAGIIHGISVLIFVCVHLKKILFSFTGVSALLFTIINTTLIFLSLFILYAGFCFFTIKKNLFSDLFIESIAEVSRVPMEYLNIIIRLFTVCVPLFYTAYIPLKEILFFDSKNICRMFFIPAFCSICSTLFSVFIFNTAKKSYRSVSC